LLTPLDVIWSKNFSVFLNEAKYRKFYSFNG
jgi:hypothetical protein